MSKLLVESGLPAPTSETPLREVLQTGQDRVEELQRRHDQIKALQDGLDVDQADVVNAEEQYEEAEQMYRKTIMLSMSMKLFVPAH